MKLEISHTLKNGSIAIAKTLDNGGKVTVAHVFNDNKTANLIVHAPDMLEMLKEYCEAFVSGAEHHTYAKAKTLINQIKDNNI